MVYLKNKNCMTGSCSFESLFVDFVQVSILFSIIRTFNTYALQHVIDKFLLTKSREKFDFSSVQIPQFERAFTNCIRVTEVYE